MSDTSRCSRRAYEKAYGTWSGSSVREPLGSYVLFGYFCVSVTLHRTPSELGQVDHRSGRVQLARLPLPIAGIVLQKIQALSCLAIKLVCDDQIRLAVVAHELELQHQLRAARQLVANGDGKRLRSCRAPAVLQPDRLQKRHRRSVNVNPKDLELVPLLGLGFDFDGESATKYELRNRNIEVLHDANHQVVRFYVNPYVSVVVQRRVLKIAYGQLGRFSFPDDFGDRVCRGHGQRRAQHETEIRLFGMLAGQLQDLRGKVFAKIDDGVVQGPSAASALAACAMVVDRLLVSRNRSKVWESATFALRRGVPRMNSFPQSLHSSRLLLP